MDFESPDVEKDFPGLYASESGRKSNESDFSDGGEHEKPSKKDLLGRRKDKKESKKDRGYAALEGESSPEEDTDTKSPSKTKKTKSFKFPTKSKEKREKSRDKEKVLEDTTKLKELSEKEKKKEREREKEREKEKKEKEKREKLREKDKEKEEKAKFKLESREKLKDDKKEKVKDKDKDKVKDKEKEKVKEKEKDKVKEKDKDKKDRKLTKMPSTVTSGVPFEEIFTLGGSCSVIMHCTNPFLHGFEIGVALPIFGVPLLQSVERSRCHDDTGLPLVVRDSIDFLEAHGLKSPQIYKTEPDKIKLTQLRKLFTDRGPTFPYHWDVPVACAMLKSFIRKHSEETCMPEFLHKVLKRRVKSTNPYRDSVFLSVVVNDYTNHANIQTVATAMGPALNMSLNLLTYFITKADKLFPEVRLTKYVPPLQSIPADFPETANEISEELRKQESLLNQIHAEMHAGFITTARDQQLWEAQRIVTQLKRKLRSVQKSVEPNAVPTTLNQPPDDKQDDELNRRNSQPTDVAPKPIELATINASIAPVEPEMKTPLLVNEPFQIKDTKESPNADPTFPVEFEDNFDFKPTEAVDEIDTPEKSIEKPKLTEKELKVLRLQLENAEYLQLKSLLQAKINSEQFEIVKLRSHVTLKNKQEGNVQCKENKENFTPEELELKQKLMKENAMLEQKRLNLVNQIFQERVACIQLKIELAMKEIMSKS
ncbi:jg21464 [Pararge aegeria aegeria]|uniref:Jg21464 protein n=1 Tax=Pararge aegeria aegeria TaxID=348720 RepID=A0A8S4RN09_9NEOP|nr:jg21464 [Pararge aegeria aegeria]